MTAGGNALRRFQRKSALTMDGTTSFTYKRQAGIIKSIFLGRGDEVTIQQYCDNCEYRTGPETRVEQ